jgi:hypothetical protein
MTMTSRLLRIALLAGVAYFCAMAVAHFFGIKWPLLFVYYDVPFHAYQDKIIAFSVVAYACLWWSAARERSVMPAVLLALGVTVAGLAAVNLSDALASVLDGRGTQAYWWQTALFAGYWLLLFVLHGRARSEP